MSTSELSGLWTYRSFNPTYVTGNQTPQKELELILADGFVFNFQTPTGTTLEGTFGLPDGGFPLDLKGTVREGEPVSFEFVAGRTSTETPVSFDIVGTGRPGTETDGWEYRYHGHLTRRWPGWPEYESDQRPFLVGSVIRAKPHGDRPAGLVYSFIAVKQQVFTSWDWKRELSGSWTYRSFHNNSTDVYQIPPTAHGRLILQEAVFRLETPTSTTLQGAIEWGTGVLDLNGTVRSGVGGEPSSFEIVGTGRPGADTSDWEYRYQGHLTRHWPEGVNQRPALLGSVLRTKPHGDSPAWVSHTGGIATGGYVAPFIAVKK
jgi:hypothetical protein